MSNVTPVVLCGGAGTRLWPLSRKSFPKQFVLSIDSMLLLQPMQVPVWMLRRNFICVASHEYRFLMAEVLQSAKAQGPSLLELVARNTVAAIAIAAIIDHPAHFLLLCPLDHHNPDEFVFAQVVQSGGAEALGCTFAAAVFNEMPAEDKAEVLLFSNRALGNADIFLCTNQTLLSTLAEHALEILQVCEQAVDTAAKYGNVVLPPKDAFAACRAESVDYAAMEYHASVAMHPFASA
jgi:mannose-1-phosphate guanylyltransferase/mannose-6-phosphate isomerase